MGIKNILIFASSADHCVNLVIDWLKTTEGTKIDRANIDNLKLIYIELNNKNNTYYHSAWFRKFDTMGLISPSSNQSIDIKYFFLAELRGFLRAIKITNLFCNKVLGTSKYNESSLDVSKIRVLMEAQQCGLSIPDTIITNSYEETVKFAQKNKKVISKPLTNGTFFDRGNISYGIYTKVLYCELLKEHTTGQVIFPSFLQQYIDKLLELRIFFINDQFFTSAIFSQNNERTKEDFRDYDYTRFNRVIPFSLPNKIKKKLMLLNKRLGLNTGSIDMILTRSYEYIFLEINPSGNFGMSSKMCNYHIEKEIAQYLYHD